MREYRFFYGPSIHGIGYTESDCPKRAAFFRQVAQNRATPATKVEPSQPTPCESPRNAALAGPVEAPRISGDCREYQAPPTQFGIAPPPKRTYTQVLGYRQSLERGPRLCRACKQLIPKEVIDKNHQATACSDECRKEVRRADKNAMRRRWRAKRSAAGNPVRQGKKRRKEQSNGL